MTTNDEVKKELPSNQNISCGCGFKYNGSARWDELTELYDNHECYPATDPPRQHWTANVFAFWPCIALMFVVGMVPLIITTFMYK